MDAAAVPELQCEFVRNTSHLRCGDYIGVIIYKVFPTSNVLQWLDIKTGHTGEVLYLETDNPFSVLTYEIFKDKPK